MIRLTLTTPPRLHTISLEPGEVGTLELDAAALLATGEELEGVTIDDAGSNTLLTPVLSGALCTIQLSAPLVNSIILGEVYLSGDAGTIIRTSLRLRSIDPLDAAAPIVTRSETLKWRGDYSGTGVYTLNDIVVTDGDLWRAKRSVSGVSPVEGDDWDLFMEMGVGTISQETIDAINALLANPPTGTMSGLLAARPAASATYRGQFYNCEGAGGDGEDILTVCLLSPGGVNYSWRVASTMFGGPA